MKLSSKFAVLKDRVAASLSAFRRDEEGATMIEYALIAALIAVLLIATLTDVKDALDSTFQSVVSAL